MKKILVTALCFLTSLLSFSQTYVTKDTTFGGWNARVSYIIGFTDSTEVIVNINGLGEVGTDPAKALVYGPHYWFANGWNGQVALGNGIHYPVYVTLQQPAGYQQPQVVKPKLDLIFARFKAKRNARYGMGLSNGGWVWHNLMYYEPTLHDHSYFNYMTAIVSLQGQRGDDNYGADPYSYPNYFGHAAKNGSFKFLAVEQINDGRDLSTVVKRMIDSVGSNNRFAFFWTNWGAGGHTNFNDMYNPAENNWTLSHPEIQLSNGGAMNTLPIAGGQNLYQWLLRQGDTTFSAAPPPSLIVNAGADKNIYLPYTFAVLPGSAEHEGYSITSYTWSKISGPSGDSVLLASTNDDTLKVHKLQRGVYVYRLTATDNNGGSAYDDVTVTVGDKPCNEAAPVTYYQGETQPGQIYLVGAAAEALPWKGGDTVYIMAGDYPGGIQINKISGDKCRPIIIKPAGVVTTTSNFRFQDGASYFEVNGLIGGVKSITSKTLGASMASNFKLTGLNVGPNNEGVGIYIKQDPYIDRIETYDGSYIMKNIIVDNIRIRNVEGEGMYIGNTAPNADPYHGFMVPIRLDSVTISNCDVDSTGWDGIQLSNARNGNKIFNNKVRNFGRNNIDAQRAGIISGGNTNSDIYNNDIAYGTGNGLQVFGYGVMNIYGNVIDSVGNLNNEQSMYGLAANNLVEANPKLQLNIYNNIIKKPLSQGAMDFRNPNTGELNLLEANLNNNTFCIPGASGSWQTTYLKFDAGWTGSNNVLGCEAPPVNNTIIRYFKLR